MVHNKLMGGGGGCPGTFALLEFPEAPKCYFKHFGGIFSILVIVIDAAIKMLNGNYLSAPPPFWSSCPPPLKPYLALKHAPSPNSTSYPHIVKIRAVPYLICMCMSAALKLILYLCPQVSSSCAACTPLVVIPTGSQLVS